MPLPTTAEMLAVLANTALEKSDIDSASVEVFAADGHPRITFASSGDPGTDRGAVGQINGEICMSQTLGELSLTGPVIVRPKDDDATLACAANALRYLATLLERAATGTDQDQPVQMDRSTAVRFAENVLSGLG
ncbi:hypothetical protein [Streptomyces javensis]|uniref:Uncharacterized protein n=1 Tax=Streptomyces javensis TaxID=114698 RepID=A0ABS0RBH3_9ACTN|nr:hypothetical protein [Streptomyces javensis]MBI0314744.1 hypothetical protein [Streptomyces javensis]